jgi:transposase
MVAEVVDAVVGVDTHRETHQAEIAAPTGALIATGTFSNTTGGFAEFLGWVAEHVPGPRVVVCIEGTRSYGIALTRALITAGLVVIEAEQPQRKTRRGKGKSDVIDAHHAVRFALGLDVDHLPTPRADGDREALQILLGTREELTTVQTAQINRLRALLLAGDDTDRALARGSLPESDLTTLARRRVSSGAGRVQGVRQGELRRLALAIRASRRALVANRVELAAIVEDLVPV